jgi:hypothetical protein
VYELREVKVCGCCLEAVVFDRDIRVATCPCGATRMPRRSLVAVK